MAKHNPLYELSPASKRNKALIIRVDKKGKGHLCEGEKSLCGRVVSGEILAQTGKWGTWGDKLRLQTCLACGEAHLELLQKELAEIGELRRLARDPQTPEHQKIAAIFIAPLERANYIAFWLGLVFATFLWFYEEPRSAYYMALAVAAWRLFWLLSRKAVGRFLCLTL